MANGVSAGTLLAFFAVIVLSFVGGAIVNVIVARILKARVRRVIYKTVSKIMMYAVYGLGFFYAFNNILAFNLGASLAALGILGAALILPMIPVLQNITSGLVLSIERPFREDDMIEINGELCKVQDVMLRKTKLRSLRGKIIYVPNLMFMTSTPVINYSEGEFIRINVPIDISSESDISKVTEIIENICTTNPNILPNIPERNINKLTKLLEIPKSFFQVPKNLDKLRPQIHVTNITKEKTSLEVWIWTWDISLKKHIVSSFFKKLKGEFEKHEIGFG
ncbi:MAG: mechanosensitive ion channel domain-containing protein [archaeon]